MKVLEVSGLSKSFNYRGKTLRAVDDVCLNIAPGEVVAFLGSNGAGKTTTIKMIAGLVKPDKGWVQIAGFNPHENQQAFKELGVVLEGNRNLYWNFTPIQNLEYFGMLKGLNRRAVRNNAIELLERFDLLAKARTQVQHLSRGMQQKLAIAVALIHQPKLLLLDEPTLGLDVEASENIKTLVSELVQEGYAILLTTHQLDVAEELSNRVVIIHQGKIITEQPTSKIIQQFSRSGYTIKIERALELTQIRALEVLGAVVQSNQDIYIQDLERLYSLLEKLKPLPIIKVEKEQADLTQIFLKITRGKRYV
ncbi:MULTISPECIES: ABC transporter ATP-binding protein [unclassified Nostoc]|uniref:ABC transporter ATP-binding protein n=1 Tax=unclassified Nostoc TaxID=2593658 RepID=UPI002AD3A6AB|nr:ABC transporter ATP-binding protein [Nostoc sp. ChiQUE01b]MDZ8261976.1 ABC transporter ATP-binding protein [Nostoc sp. ChiQUE01b]